MWYHTIYIYIYHICPSPPLSHCPPPLPIRLIAQNSSFPPSVSAAPKPEISSERFVNVEEKHGKNTVTKFNTSPLKNHGPGRRSFTILGNGKCLGANCFISGGYVQHLKWKSSFSQHLGTELTLQYNQFTNLDLQSSGFLLQISIKVAKCIKKLWDCVKQTAPTSKLPSKHSQRLDPELSENEAS